MTCQKCTRTCFRLSGTRWYCAWCRQLFARVELRADMKRGEGICV